MNIIRVLLAALLLGAGNAVAAAPAVTGVVTVSSADAQGSVGIGFVADAQGHVLVRMNPPNETLLVRTVQGQERQASKVAYDSVSRIALLKVSGDVSNLAHYTFAKGSPQMQRKVYGVRIADPLPGSQLVAGTLAGLREATEEDRPDYFLHNALVDELGEGAPLLNNCGEVIGAVVPKPGFNLFNLGDEATAYAIPAAWLVEKFSGRGLSVSIAADDCLSEQAQAEAERQAVESRAAEEARRARDAAAQADAARAELDELRRQQAELQGASEEERNRLQEEIEASQARLDQLAQQEAAAVEAREQAERETEQQREQYTQWGIIGGGALLLIILLVWILKQRSLARERREKAAAQIRAEEASADAAAAQADLAARQQDEERIRQTPTVFLEGVDPAGKALALRVPGPSIAKTGGAVVGRNPGDSEFVLNHLEVSRRHFRLFSDGRLLMVEDLGSTNGTVVDDKPLAPGDEAVLVDQSRVQLGELTLTARLEQG